MCVHMDIHVDMYAWKIPYQKLLEGILLNKKNPCEKLLQDILWSRTEAAEKIPYERLLQNIVQKIYLYICIWIYRYVHLFQMPFERLL